ncbi:MFS transporter, SP family, inositol transporter [Alteromonadaceae bacterium Bs31]|nr:MFS transporter, SP family, inositol transporter [Alteromonadaceae bacterium Bs31]
MNQTELRTSEEEPKITRQQWKWTVLAGMASYLDAGSIVALGAGLALFQSYLNLSNSAVGALAAIGPNAIGCAIGAFLGGWLGDKIGRKRIYQYDLLVYAAGILCIALAVNVEMLFIGTFVVGVAVGADVPTSLALVGELAPAKARGKLLGLTQVAWSLGPVVVLWLAVLLAPLELLGIRIIFLHLFVAAIVTWALRRGLSESARWQSATKVGRTSIRKLFRGAHLKALIWTATIYLFWNLAAGTAGIFNPYFINKLNAGSQAASVALASAGFVITLIVTASVFMRFSDRSFRSRKWLWGVGAVMQIVAYALFLFLPFSVPVIIANILLFSAGAALAGEAFYKVFSQELFPTLLRGTAQGITFGIARTILGFWSFFVPVLASAGIGEVAGLLTLFLLISGGVGFFFMPDTSGKSLEQIESERAEL